MSRTQMDSVIDDDEETCPLCIEEFDLGDKNFRPCPCGYQICQFCFNSLKNTYDKSTCPNCRRPYDEKTIQYKIPTAEDIKQDLLNKNKRQVAAKRRETEKKEVEASSRRNLAGVRVKQQNLVYVIGLVPTMKDEQQLLQTLRGDSYFGQYGDIEKIVVSKAKIGAANQGIGVYVTFARKEDAATCIGMVDGSQNGDRVLRAQYGTTKYCSAYLRGETCNNKNCTFLHESGEDGQNSSLQNEPSQPPRRPAMVSHASHAAPIGRPAAVPSKSHVGKDETGSRKGSTDASALPTTASWATNPSQQAVKVRRESQTASHSSQSPQVANATLLQPETKRKDSATPPAAQTTKQAAPSSRAVSSQMSSVKSSPRSNKTRTPLDDVIASVNSPDFRFVFDDTTFSKDDLAAIYRIPTMIDPFGGAKRRIMRDKEANERAKVEAEAQKELQATATSAIDAIDDEQLASGSLQLGGEPEDVSQPDRRDDSQNAIGRPLAQLQANSTMNDQFSNLSIDGRSLTPHQRQQLALLSSANVQQAPGLTQQAHTGFSGSGFDPADQRSNLFANQQAPYDGASGHARQSSRFSFGNEAAKSAAATRYNQPNASGQQHYYPSGVQGPPPGLKTAGTPPISGGGMFAQGHGFTSNMSSAFGASKDTSSDMFLRGRSGTGSGHDAKRESFPNSNPTRSPTISPAPSLLNSLYGSGAFQDPGLLKQKKKGKKHRHANTSSTGGGVVDLADPSILQARLQQSGAGAGQGLFGGQSQEDQDFPPLESAQSTHVSRFFPTQGSIESGRRPGTPKVPPGLSLPHSHPPPGLATPDRSRTPAQTPGIVAPALPLIPGENRSSTPIRTSSLLEKSTPIDAQADEKVDTEREDDAAAPSKPSDISTGSPKPKSAKVEEKRPVPAAAETAQVEAPVASPSKEQSQPLKVATRAAKPKQIDLSSLKHTITSGTSTDATKALTEQANLVSTPGTMSRPATPGVSKTPDPASVPRPRTLRLTTTSTTPKPAETPTLSATAEKAPALPAVEALKIHSRRPSIASLAKSSRPASPAISEMAESSVNMSRASSPPPSIVGSAPEKFKSKNQLKKERKAKAMEVDEAASIATPSSQKAPSTTAPPADDVGPIISRQKKKQKPQKTLSAPKPAKAADPVRGTTSDGKASEVETVKSGQESPSKKTKKNEAKPKEEVVVPKAESPVPLMVPSQPESPLSDEPPYIPTLRDFYHDLKRHAAQMKGQDIASLIPDLLDQYISDAPAMLAQMFECGEIDPKSALFNPPSLNTYRLPNGNAAHSPSGAKNSAFEDQTANQTPAYELTFGPQGSFSGQYAPAYPFGTITLTNGDRKTLLGGYPIRVNDPSHPSDLHHRFMITPRGTVYRHMSAEEEEKVLDLESRMDDASLLGLYGPEDVDDDVADEYGNEYGDYENLRGGVEDLINRPARHGIVWASTGSSMGRKSQARRKADHQPVRTSHSAPVMNQQMSHSHGSTATGSSNPLDEHTAADDGYDQDDEESGDFSDDISQEDSEGSSTFGDDDLLSIMPNASPSTNSGGIVFPFSNVDAPPHLRVRTGAVSGSQTARALAAGLPITTTATSNSAVSRDAIAANLNLRTMDVASLINRINSSKAEMEALKKEVETLEKKVVRRGKDVGRWRDGIMGLEVVAAGGGGGHGKK